MPKSVYQKNPGRDSGWIVEGELDESDFQQFGRNNDIVSLEFQSISGLPERPFRHLASMRRLKHLDIRSCPLTPADMHDIASLSKLESLWIANCLVDDAGVEALSQHPKLFKVTFEKTRITDAAIKHLAAIPRLEWLWLDGNAITDRGLAHLMTAAGLKSLAVRDTAITDDGILQLAVLPKLDLAAGHVRGTGVTEPGLDALFAAQKAQRKAARVRKPLAKETMTLAPEEIEAAKNVLYGFFRAMAQWETDCHEALESRPGLDVDEQFWARCRASCRQVFREYCTSRTRAYGRPDNISIGSPPDYQADPAQEPVTSIEAPDRRRIVIETKQQFAVKYRCQYVLLKKDGKWLIDNKKVWSGGWESTIL